MAKKTNIIEDHSTEEKIKQAARKIFTQKGYAAARTRDIAEEAGINLALLNYYFRSKEKLFDMVMGEQMQQFIRGMRGVFHNEDKTLIQKVTEMADNYIELLKANPDLPIFVLSEIRANPEKFAAKMNVKSVIANSHFMKQIAEETKGKLHPIHFLMNIMGLVVFPFIASPLLKTIGNLKHSEFNNLMEERKKMIPIWIKAMLKAK